MITTPSTTDNGTEAISVLHVDDDPNLADLAAIYLAREDDQINVQTVVSVADGLEFLAEHDVDCIVSDYEMPNRDGIEFLKAVRDKYPNLPFILYTGKGSEEVASEAIAAGVSDYLQKESGTDQYTILANRIRNYVERTRAQQKHELVCERMQLAVNYPTLLSHVCSFLEDGASSGFNDATCIHNNRRRKPTSVGGHSGRSLHRR